MKNGVTKQPFLPRDFDERYFQSAPADQQIDFPIGNEVIVLNNIHPLRSKINFKLPRLNNIPVRFYQRQGEVVLFTPSVDTLYFEPEKDFFCNLAVPITYSKYTRYRANSYRIKTR